MMAPPTIHAYNEGSGFAGHFITNSGTYALFCGNKDWVILRTSMVQFT
ncbi:MAG: hypothetical protein IPH57_06670 [Saprospiraceae bacterium]|nr:hypothetical protein [Saprospiraceae bacterium]